MIYTGDCLDILPTLDAESVQCVVTSPPYYGLRSYGIGTENGEIGLESTPEIYVAKLVEVFRQVRRVLRDDGTVWLNLGDSYNGSGHKDVQVNSPKQMTSRGATSQRGTFIDGLKPKDLIGIPWRVAFALQADGWYLRQDIIWHKPNPMPESVTDRCTKSHEYIFLLTKSAKYFYDAEAVKEGATGAAGNRKVFRGYGDYTTQGKSAARYGLEKQGNQVKGNDNKPIESRNRRSVWTITTKPFKSVFSYGKYRIASPDCPVHDYHADLGRALECDALLASSQLDRMMNNGIHPFPLREGVVVSIPLDHPSFPFDGISAIPRSMRNYKKADELKQDEIFFGISPYRIEYKELIDHSISKCVHTRGNNTEVDVFQGVSGSYPSGQTRYRIFCILTWAAPPFGCLCHYTGSLKKGQDHFAVFPPEIPEICIKAGTSEKGCCPECGSPWERVVEKEGSYKDCPSFRPRESQAWTVGSGGMHCGHSGNMPTVKRNYTGWRSTCMCGEYGPCATDDITHLPSVPCTVLDPFSGAGTTGLVAERLGRKYIGIELNKNYANMSEKRIESAEMPLFKEVDGG